LIPVPAILTFHGVAELAPQNTQLVGIEIPASELVPQYPLARLLPVGENDLGCFADYLELLGDPAATKRASCQQVDMGTLQSSAGKQPTAETKSEDRLCLSESMSRRTVCGRSVSTGL